jgi:hypothetical protein
MSTQKLDVAQLPSTNPYELPWKIDASVEDF